MYLQQDQVDPEVPLRPSDQVGPEMKTETKLTVANFSSDTVYGL